MNVEQEKSRYKQSWALGASVLLHVLVLLGLGGGKLPGPALEPGIMAVYLAMPASIAERAPVPPATSEKMTETKPMQTRAEPQIRTKPQKVITQPSAEIMTPDEILQPEPVTMQKVEVAKQPETITGKSEAGSCRTTTGKNHEKIFSNRWQRFYRLKLSQKTCRTRTKSFCTNSR